MEGMLSRDKYDRMRKRLSATYKDGEWNRRSFEGVNFPRLRTRYAMDKRVAEIKALYGVKTLNDGLSAFLDLRAVLAANVRDSVKTGHFHINSEHQVSFSLLFFYTTQYTLNFYSLLFFAVLYYSLLLFLCFVFLFFSGC